MENEKSNTLFGDFHAEYTSVLLSDGTLYLEDIGHVYTRTVTNDAEYVVQRLMDQYGDLSQKRIFYKDSDDRIDEILVKNSAFYGFAPGSSDMHLTLAQALA